MPGCHPLNQLIRITHQLGQSYATTVVHPLSVEAELLQVVQRPDEPGQLARAFQKMAMKPLPVSIACNRLKKLQKPLFRLKASFWQP
jgi:hypothetical protein